MDDAQRISLHRLLTLLDRCETPLMRLADWQDLSESARATLVDAGLLRHIPVHFPIPCPWCGQHCPLDPEEPITHDGPTFTGLCPDPDQATFTVAIPRAQAQAWVPEWSVLLQRIRAALPMQMGTAELVPGRLWQLGRIALAGETRKLFLVRGLWWSHDRRPWELLAQPSRAHGALVLTLADPPVELPPFALPEHVTTIPLTECLILQDGRLTVRLQGMGELHDAPPPVLAPPPRVVPYPLRVDTRRRQLILHETAVSFSPKVFDVLLALAHLHLRMPGVWRSFLDIAEQAYGQDEYPTSFDQVVKDKIKIIRDKSELAHLVSTEDKFRFIETGDGEYRFHPGLVTIQIDPE